MVCICCLYAQVLKVVYVMVHIDMKKIVNCFEKSRDNRAVKLLGYVRSIRLKIFYRHTTSYSLTGSSNVIRAEAIRPMFPSLKSVESAQFTLSVDSFISVISVKFRFVFNESIT